jgi:hypothetical protein
MSFSARKTYDYFETYGDVCHITVISICKLVLYAVIGWRLKGAILLIWKVTWHFAVGRTVEEEKFPGRLFIFQQSLGSVFCPI